MLDLGLARVQTRALAIAGAAVACLVVCGVTATGALAAAATTLPAQDVGPIAPFTDNNGYPISIADQATEEGIPYVVRGTCPAWVTDDALYFTFSGGSAVLYRSGNGGNVQGQATLNDLTNPVYSGIYSGHAHLWFGSNINPTGNQQAYFGETGSFQGTGTDGTSLKITANPGFNTSASGNVNGWGQVSVTCS